MRRQRSSSRDQRPTRPVLGPNESRLSRTTLAAKVVLDRIRINLLPNADGFTNEELQVFVLSPVIVCHPKTMSCGTRGRHRRLLHE